MGRDLPAVADMSESEAVREGVALVSAEVARVREALLLLVDADPDILAIARAEIQADMSALEAEQGKLLVLKTALESRTTAA